MLVYDIEADGLYESAKVVHCVVIDLDSEIYRFYDTSDIYIEQKEGDLDLNRNNLLEIFNRNEGKIICHNQLGYDCWMLKKFFQIDLVELFGFERMVDTWVWSQALHPDREMPRGCPNIIKLDNGTTKRIGPHGLDSWGYRTNREKPSIASWDTFDNSILNRCVEDVGINKATYKLLCKERGDLSETQ